MVINDRICAEVVQKVYVIRRYSRNGSQTRATRQLNHINSNVSCRPVNDYRLARPKLGLIKQRLSCRDGYNRNRSSFNVG